MWNGKLPIYEAGEYEFSTRSDDGSILWLGGYSDADKLVDNWGLHGAKTVKATKMLPKGWYDVNVEFFEKGGGANCIVKYKGPDTGGNEALIEVWHDPTA